MKILVSPKGNFTGGLQKLPLIPRSQFHTPPAQEQIPSDPFVRRDPGVRALETIAATALCWLQTSSLARNEANSLWNHDGLGRFELLERGVHLHWQNKNCSAQGPTAGPGCPQPWPCCGPTGAPSCSAKFPPSSSHQELCQDIPNLLLQLREPGTEELILKNNKLPPRAQNCPLCRGVYGLKCYCGFG